jgi:hypothetical protein
MNMTAKELRTRIKASLVIPHEGRCCFVCQLPIPLGSGGTYHADLGIATHGTRDSESECLEIVNEHRRDYSQSSRGRWRPKYDALLRIVENLEATKPSAPHRKLDTSFSAYDLMERMIGASPLSVDTAFPEKESGPLKEWDAIRDKGLADPYRGKDFTPIGENKQPDAPTPAKCPRHPVTPRRDTCETCQAARPNGNE